MSVWFVVPSPSRQNLDLDVAWFASRVSTTENVAVFCWEALRAAMPEPALLHKIVVYETANNSVTYKGQ